MERDDAAAAPVLVLRRRDVDVAVRTNGEMAYRTQPVGDDGGVEAWRQRQTIWFLDGREDDGRAEDQRDA